MKVKELLKTEDKWTQGYYARTKTGTFVDATNRSAVCYCLRGAVEKCYRKAGARIEAEAKLRAAIRKFTKGQCLELVTFNDALGRTFEDIKKVVELADV